MADDLARRMAARQIQMAADDLTRDAERLAVAARQYADDLAAGRHGSAHRLAQDAADLALTERRLAGMREIEALMGETEDPS
jgi:hypothetical protein